MNEFNESDHVERPELATKNEVIVKQLNQISELNKSIDYLLNKMYEITEAESDRDMFDIAEESLAKFNRKRAIQPYEIR